MKLTVKYIKIGRKNVLKDQKYLYHACVVPITKKIWYFHVDLKVRSEIEFWGSDCNTETSMYIPVDKEALKKYLVVSFKHDKEFRIFAQQSKASFHGIAVEEPLIGRAWDKYARYGDAKVITKGTI